MAIPPRLRKAIPRPLRSFLKAMITKAYLLSRMPLYRFKLEVFLRGEGRLVFPKVEEPELSVIAVIRDREERSYLALASLLTSQFACYELIVIDDACRGRARQAPRRLDNATIIVNEGREGDQASRYGLPDGPGRSTLVPRLRRPDSRRQPGLGMRAMDAAIDLGALGGKIVTPDGKLESAGGILWQDGSSSNYGRGGDPLNYAHMFARNIDFVPGGFVLTRREHYVREMAGEPIQGGGPDTEWAEYGIRLLEGGQRSSYDPDVAVRRLGDGRLKPDVSGGEEQRERLAKHMDWLASRPPRSAMYGLAARSHGKAKTRLLMIDDRVPHPYLGAGYPRTNLILSELIGKGYAITYYAMFVQEDWAEIYRTLDRRIEVVFEYGSSKLPESLASAEWLLRPGFHQQATQYGDRETAPVRRRLRPPPKNCL